MTLVAATLRPSLRTFRASLSSTGFKPRRLAFMLSTSKDPHSSVVYENLLVETIGNVGVIRLYRPKALNALSSPLFEELLDVTTGFDEDETIGCMVLTGGSDKAFAAGADITEMKDKTFDQTYKTNMFRGWNDITRLSTPIIAAVNGWCLGGGCELAMMCDFILAGRKAKFGQPEINLGVIPGAGGTQRLTAAIGKSKAMWMVLTGDMISAEEAERAGLVAKVFEPETLVDEAVQMAQKIAMKGRMSTYMAKEAVNVSQELGLQEGLRFERRLFHALFATADQKEGMNAFLEKRDPNFKNK